MFGVDDAALAILAAGLATSAGTMWANHQNLKNQKHVNDVNWQIAAQNNATQIEMANTAHQREVADLRAAGLNPILSAGGNGSSTPSLTSMRGDSAQVENPVNGIANSAQALARYVGQQYRTQLEQAKEDVNATKLSNQLASYELRDIRTQLENDYQMETMRKDALETLFGTQFKYDDDKGTLVSVICDSDRYQKGLELIQEGIISDLKNSANSNLRNWIQSLSGAVNSAGSVIRTMRGSPSPTHYHNHYH